MVNYLVGTGGWAYFPTGEKSKLNAYSKVFNFVEVNSTFYEYPSLRTVENWRRIVPSGFTFSVRCNQDLTHRIGLKPVNGAYEVLGRILEYCRILSAPYLILETPASYMFSDKNVSEAADFLGSVNLRGLRLVWENRSPLTPKAIDLMQGSKIVHSADLSKEEPFFSSDVLYTRLFGKGKHNIYQFSDSELKEIDYKILHSNATTVAMSYHGVRMNTDALRFVHYKKTGKFPSVTGLSGVASAKAVLAEDARFPTSKEALIEDQGWKIFDASAESRVHLADWLKCIPEGTYSSIDDVATALETTR